MMRSSGAKLLILAAGADPQSLGDLEANLASAGHEVMTASSGHAALHEIRKDMPDLIILDIAVPSLLDPELCDRIRDASPALPIIILSSKASESDKVVALDLGADDYLTKPFSIDELLARIRALLRRSTLNRTPTGPLEVGDFTIERDLRRISVLSKEIGLTPKEFDILNHLLSNPKKTVTQREILVAVWGPESSEQTDYLRVFISRLRRKVEPDPTHPRYILTVPWIGYRIEPGGEPIPSSPGQLP
jgi:two-component system KDP operon response regulator KdpE